MNNKNNADCEAICNALWGGYDHTRMDVGATKNTLDNTVSVRLYLLLRGTSTEVYDVLVEPYDNGYYKRADGKSSPFGFFKVEFVQKKIGFKKDIVSVRHDFDYYTGIDRKDADERYRDLQLKLGHPRWVVAIEYRALRWFGGFAWKKHEKRRESEPGYGLVEHITNLPVFREKDQ